MSCLSWSQMRSLASCSARTWPMRSPQCPPFNTPRWSAHTLPLGTARASTTSMVIIVALIPSLQHQSRPNATYVSPCYNLVGQDFSTVICTIDPWLANAGFMFCNGPPYNATVGEVVRLYVITLGTEAGVYLLLLLTNHRIMNLSLHSFCWQVWMQKRNRVWYRRTHILDKNC